MPILVTCIFQQIYKCTKTKTFTFRIMVEGGPRVEKCSIAIQFLGTYIKIHILWTLLIVIINVIGDPKVMTNTKSAHHVILSA